MDPSSPLTHQILDEDLQIIRVTLATIADDVRHFSPPAAEAVQNALLHLDQARKAFNRPDQPASMPVLPPQSAVSRGRRH